MADQIKQSAPQGQTAVAANSAQPALTAAESSSPTVKAETYQVVVKAPASGGMLAYLVGPGADIVLQGIDLNKSTMAVEGGNLRITLPNGSEVLLLDYVTSAKDPSTTITTAEGHLPAQQLLAALGTEVAQKNADVEPAAGDTGGEGGGITPPTILGTGVGEGSGVFSSVIGTFSIPRPLDAIATQEFPFESGPMSGTPPVVTPGNLPPFARNDSFSTAVNVPLTLNPGQLLVNDTDPENDTLTIISVQGPLHGTVALVGGQVVFTPENGYHGTGSFSYTISDGHGNTSTADVIIQIDPTFEGQNTVIAADDAYTIPEAGRAITMNVLANDSDPEGDALVPGSVRIISGPAIGTATVNPDGTISYQSVGRDPYFTTLVYEVSDARGARDTATVTIEVKPAANSVDAIDDTGEIIPAGATKTFNVTNNDVDPQGDAFAITNIVSILGGGTASFNAATGEITYNSVSSPTGYTAEIVYEITDARGATDQATLYVRVEPVNNVSAVDDTADLKAGQDVRIDVLDNDFDAQGDNFHITRIAEQPRDANGNARGSVTINSDGTITYTDTPGAREAGVVEFKYEVMDDRGATDTAVVRVTIGTAPNGVDANNDTITISEDAPRTEITDRMLANDFDPQNDAFSITSISSIPASQGTLELVGGHVFFTPAHDYNGPVVFNYTITDSKGATDTAQVLINVQEQPDGLNAGDDNFTTPFNTDLTITPAQLLANDNDPDGTILGPSNIISFTQPAHGTVTMVNGNFVFNPEDTFHGTTSFTYTIEDDQGETDTAVVTIRVGDPLSQDNPVDAVDDLVILHPGETKSVNVLTNDSAPDGGLAFVRLIDPLPAGVTNLGNGVFSYHAPDNTTGQSVSFRYEARDVDGDTDIATVTFRVEGPVNSVDARDDVVTMAKDVNSILIDAKANDFDPEGDTFHITNILSVTGGGTATIENDQVRYVNNTRDAGTATIVYEITDSKGAKDTATITVNIVADTNSVDAVDDTVTMGKDVNSILINAKANDFDPQGDEFHITNIISVNGGGTAVIENDQVRYTNTTRDAGTATIVYEITDSKGAKDTATITVNIVADTNSVVAVDDTVTMAKDVNSILINAKANDFDPEGDSFSITNIVSVNGGGTASIENGQIRYTNPTRDAGTATIVYEITDSKGAKDTATITVNIVADTNSVVAVDDSTSMDHGTFKVINVKANDFDPQGDSFSVTRIVSGPSIGSAFLNSNGTITYISSGAINSAYTTTFVYEITDSKGAKDTAVVTVHVDAKDIPPPVTPPSNDRGGDADPGATRCPLTIDLNGDGIQINMLSQSTAHFDLAGNGHAEWTAWVSGQDDAILAVDRNNDGSINGIQEVFGGENLDGFTELARLEDTNNDGVIDANDANFNQLKLWLDANHDGITDDGELHTLAEFGITSISLKTNDTSIQYGDAYISKESTVTYADGHTSNAGSVFYTNDSNGHINGTSGGDVLVFSKAADSIDGGQGFDTMKVLTASEIVINHDVQLKGTEAIDLHNNGADKLTINAADVLNIADNGVLTIKGDAVDEINMTNATRGDNVTAADGHTYASFTATNGGTVMVELGLTVNNEHLH